MRATRSEFEANEAQARAALPRIARTLAIEATRKEWREVLAERDAKRAQVSRRMARRAQRGRSLVGMVAAIVAAAASLFPFVR